MRNTLVQLSPNNRDWATSQLRVCAEGCYKHRVDGKWVCCKCGT